MSERDLRALQDLLARRLGLQWSDVVEWLRSVNSLDEIERRLATGRLDEVVIDVTAAAEKFAAELHQAYVTSGQQGAAWLDKQVADSLVRFDAAAPQVIARARANSYEQVVGLNYESRILVRQAVTDGVTLGQAPRETARQIRDSIGLAPQQERWLANYRRSLEQGDWSRALSYETSSGHVDRAVRRLQRDGGSMTSAQVERAVEAWRQNGVNQRAETIARTESLRAAHEGGDDAMWQAIGRGDVQADELESEWHSGPATKYARPDHRKMNGRRVTFGTDFVLPDGTRMRHPGDPRGGAKHCANCRCTVSVTFAAKALAA